MKKRNLLGHIVSGSLSDGFELRISPAIPHSLIKTGHFVSVITEKALFFSLITDLKLAVTHPDILLFPPTNTDTFLTDILREHGMYATANLKLMLMIDTQTQTPQPVKIIPPHFCPVYEATDSDIASIFGTENDPDNKYFTVGYPLDMDTPVCINLEKLTERSTGIFGKTGTGKTFITRLLLAGIIAHRKGVNLIFDMHSEYGLQARQENSSLFVKGLKTLFGSQVAIFSLDPASTRRRGATPDYALVLDYQSVHVEDILSLHDELNLHSTALEAAYLLSARYKQEWLSVLLSQGDKPKELALECGGHPESLAALYRKLKRIESLPFFSSSHKSSNDSSMIDCMMEYLDKGINIIVEFGNYTSTFIYLLIANIITRRIHAAYIAKTEKFLGSHKKEDEPQKLVITIEEAHKFLSPSAARQTIFGTIAREMRKYYVSLLIVDQRPSGIDEEILSQIGTKIVALLNDEKDISAVLTGMSNAPTLRTLVTTLDSKKQVVLLGHAVPIPIVIQTRPYDEKFYAALLNNQPSHPTAIELNRLIEEIF